MYSNPELEELRISGLSSTCVALEKNLLIERDHSWSSKVQAIFENCWNHAVSPNNGYFYLLVFSEYLLDSETFKSFFKLPQAARNSLAKNNSALYPSAIKLYLDLLLKLEIHGAPFYTDSIEEFKVEVNSLSMLDDIAERTKASSLTQAYDLIDISLERPGFRIRGYGNYIIKTCIELIVFYYGENKVSEVLDRVAEENPGIVLEQLFNLLEGWESLKDFPLPWALELVSGKNKE